MRRAAIIVTESTATALIDWAHSVDPNRRRPTLDEAASVMLDEWAKQRHELRDKFAAAERVVDRILAGG